MFVRGPGNQTPLVWICISYLISYGSIASLWNSELVVISRKGLISNFVKAQVWIMGVVSQED